MFSVVVGNHLEQATPNHREQMGLHLSRWSGQLVRSASTCYFIMPLKLLLSLHPILPILTEP